MWRYCWYFDTDVDGVSITTTPFSSLRFLRPLVSSRNLLQSLELKVVISGLKINWVSDRFQSIKNDIDDRRFERIKNDSDDFEMMKGLSLDDDDVIHRETPEKGNHFIIERPME